jgi:hypothetical protein
MDATNEKPMTCARCGLTSPWNGDWYGYLCPTCADEMDSIDGQQPTGKPRQFKLTVPTYNANYFGKQTLANLMEEFSAPHVPILVHEAEGVRIVLGTHDYDEMDKPDIQIERRANGWAVFLHPLGGSDASGFIYFLDDGRSYLLKEHAGGPTPEIEVLEAGVELEELDRRQGASLSNNMPADDEPIIRIDHRPESLDT